MTWTAPAIQRRPTLRIGTERAVLESWLNHHRDTLLWKCSGLDIEQLRMRPAKPSNLSLLGLVRHMAEVERWWFRRCLQGEPLGDIYRTESSPGADLDDVDTADAEADFALYLEEVRLADAAAVDCSLETTFFYPFEERDFELRWVYVHMVEEYARHNGHADIIREQIDGNTGV
ncbi:hypothetical protein F4553_003037 [Allocatelliglobosispora scoriae]|uniref:DinB family protein n=1 Tax=Allocatelliglobosispora scoriae TaxID=643052 RepID=A0A841BQJ8_9ACTN|nr:DinB family protein [Allocatelliglobosispora scoriae]MBB5869658.1 hypothetical protein [Allocatelliglobosispora scoriae]